MHNNNILSIEFIYCREIGWEVQNDWGYQVLWHQFTLTALIKTAFETSCKFQHEMKIARKRYHAKMAKYTQRIRHYA